MTEQTTYVRFDPPRRLTEYAGQAGMEVGGQRLTPAAYEAIAEAKRSGLPCELVVIGEYVRPDGKGFLSFGTPPEYIEAVTDYRRRRGEDGKPDSRLRLWCANCEMWDGKHTKSCDR